MIELEATPYAEYPTKTRFRRPDYKFFKTFDDGECFKTQAESHRDQLPPTPPVILNYPVPPPRPKTAFSTNNLQNLRQLLPNSALPSKSKVLEIPTSSWRPVYPEPDLSTPRLSDLESALEDDRPNSEVSVEITPSRSPVDYVEDGSQRPKAPEPPATTPSRLKSAGRSAQRAQSAKPSVTLAVAEAVDFDREVEEATKPLLLTSTDFNAPQQPKQRHRHVCLATTGRKPLGYQRRPQTAPPRVLGDWQGTESKTDASLKIQGKTLVSQDRPRTAQSPPVNVNALSAAHDEALEKYGWRMQIPGDPYGLKKKFIPPRKAFTVTVPEPKTKPLPPKMRRENRYTFFHTTVPRVTLSFDIHPTFTSEQYNKARNKFLKSGDWDYNYRDFAFIY